MRRARSRDGTRRSEAPPTGWLPSRPLVAFICVVAALAGCVMAAVWEAPPSGALARYPELRYVSSATADAVAFELSEGDTRRVLREGPSRLRKWVDPAVREKRVAHLLQSGDPKLPLSILRNWLVEDALKSRGGVSWTSADEDERCHPDAWFLRGRAAAEIDAVALRIARDADLHVETRISSFVVLCRPGNPAAAEALADVALNPDEPETLRREALARIPRCGAPLPPRLHALLDVPFQGMDLFAATALGSAGDATSPTLVLDMLRWTARPRSPVGLSHAPWAGLAIEAVRRLAGGDAAIDAAVAKATAVLAADRAEFRETAATSASVVELADAFALWLDRHPEARATPWERAHAERLARAREVVARHLTIDDIVECDEDSLDIVAASRPVSDGDIDSAVVLVAGVDRVAAWLRPQIPAGATPVETLARMQHLLVPRRQSSQAMMDDSDVSTVLITRAGNCVGWTLTFVALGHRLGLPLRAVSLPGHVFVRWEDDTARVNWDPANAGASLTDDEAVLRFARPDAAARHVHPQILSRRQLVSIAHSNRASYWLNERPHASEAPLAVRYARYALRLDPMNSDAHFNLVAGLAATEPPDTAELRHAAEIAEQLVTEESQAIHLAQSLVRASLGEDALALLDRHPAADRDSPPRKYLQASALCTLGRYSEALPIADALAAEAPKDIDVAVLAVTAAFGVDTDRGWRSLDAAATRLRGATVESGPVPDTALTRLLLDVAKRIFDDGLQSAERAHLALEIVELLIPSETAAAGVSAPLEIRRRLRQSDAKLRRSWIDRPRDELRARARERMGDTRAAEEIRAADANAWK